MSFLARDPPDMAIAADVGTCEWLVNELAHLHLLENQAVQLLLDEFLVENPYADANAFGDHLVALGHLTGYQLQRILDGETDGLVLGQYIVTGIVGFGSFGPVYEACGRLDQRRYVIKMVPERNPMDVRAARRHAETLPTASHPAIVPFVEVGSGGGFNYLAWELAEGRPLTQVVAEEGPISSELAVQILLEAADALAWCRSNRTFHGTLKPSNILVCPDGQTRLLDFGLGVLLADAGEDSLIDTLASANQFLHMLDFASPESLIDPARRSVTGDQYSLGCSLYFALSGRPPFRDPSAIEKMKAHQDRTPESLSALVPGISPDLASVVDRMLQKSPGSRFASPNEIMISIAPYARSLGFNVPGLSDRFRHSVDLGSGRLPADSPARNSSGLLRIRMAGTNPADNPLQTPMPHVPKLAIQIPQTNYVPVQPPLTALATHVELPRPSLVNQLFNCLRFWLPAAEQVEVTLLVPQNVLPGEPALLQILAHTADKGDKARTMTNWIGTTPLPIALPRGTPIELHLQLAGVPLNRDYHRIVWQGATETVNFTARIPRNWRTENAASGLLTIGLNRTVVGRLPIQFNVVPTQVPPRK